MKLGIAGPLVLAVAALSSACADGDDAVGGATGLTGLTTGLTGATTETTGMTSGTTGLTSAATGVSVATTDQTSTSNGDAGLLDTSDGSMAQNGEESNADGGDGAVDAQDADAGSTGGGLSAFPSVDGKWADSGPFEVAEIDDGPDHTIHYPTDLGRDGLRHPVILWGNGTGATPSAYRALLRHWASHGFIVAAANTTQAGSGAAMLAGAQWLIAENARPESPFFEKVAVNKIGATGHSQGGGGAIAAGADPAVMTTVPIQPGPQGQISALHGPMFILGGADDNIVDASLLVEPRYEDATHIEAIYGLLADADHFEPSWDGGAMRGYVTAWLRLHLMGDESARGEFYGPSCGMCGDPAWTVQRNYE